MYSVTLVVHNASEHEGPKIYHNIYIYIYILHYCSLSIHRLINSIKGHTPNLLETILFLKQLDLYVFHLVRDIIHVRSETFTPIIDTPVSDWTGNSLDI